MNRIIIRNDDVNPSSDFQKIKEIYGFLRSRFPQAEIWSCVTLFSKTNTLGAVYPDLPLKSKEFAYFLKVDSFLSLSVLNGLGRIVSHGVWHFDHSRLGYDVQYVSIAVSCHYLGAKAFVPPFHKYNSDTEKICFENGIELIKPSSEWKNLEENDFDTAHPKWFFHSWRLSVEEFKRRFENEMGSGDRQMRTA